MVCGHSTIDGAGQFDTSQLFPDLDPALVRTLLQRSRYSDSQEQEAEVMASLLLSRLDHRPPAASDGTTTLTSRLERALLPPQQQKRRTDA